MFKVYLAHPSVNADGLADPNPDPFKGGAEHQAGKAKQGKRYELHQEQCPFSCTLFPLISQQLIQFPNVFFAEEK